MSQPSEADELPAEIVSLMRRKLHYIQIVPEVASQAINLSKDPNCKLEEFVALVNRDVKLAFDMLSLANSAAFSRGRPVSNLQQAVSVLGLEISRNLIMTACLFSMAEQMPIQEARIRSLLWRHSYLTGVLATQLNRALSVGFHGEEFTGGFLHDIGRMLLAVMFPDQFNAADPLDFDDGPHVLRRERDVFGATHTAVGAWFLEYNHLPENLVYVVRYHHDPERAEGHQRFVALIAAADHLANHVQRTLSTAGYDPAENAALACLESTGVSHTLKSFEKAAAKILEEANQALQRLGGSEGLTIH